MWKQGKFNESDEVPNLFETSKTIINRKVYGTRTQLSNRDINRTNTNDKSHQQRQ